MLEILFALIAFTTLSIWGTNTDCYNSFFKSVFCPVLATFGFISLIIYAVLGWTYFAAGYKADIINKEFETTYTQEQIFYASDVIDEIQNLKRKRIEVSGNLLTGKKP